MSVYTVEVTLTGRAAVRVEANSKEEAIKKIEDGYETDILGEETEVNEIMWKSLRKEDEHEHG